MAQPLEVTDPAREEIQCIFCQADNARTIIEENGYTGRQCSRCGLIYVSPRPCRSAMLMRYHNDEAQGSSQTYIGRSILSTLYAKHNLGIIRRFYSSGSLLEIGSGGGYFLAEASKRGFDVCGIELNRTEADFIRNENRLACETVPLHAGSFGDRRFDVIYHCDVLSHFHDPVDELRKMHDKLTEDGIVVFETGNLAELPESVLRTVDTFLYPDHLFFFGEKSLRLLLDRAGFELTTICRFSLSLQLVLLRWQRRLTRQRPPANASRTDLSDPHRGTLPPRSSSEQHEADPDGHVGLEPSAVMRPLLRAVRLFAKAKFPRTYRLLRETLPLGAKSLCTMAGEYVQYFARYKAGRWLPKQGRQQTLIVIARKKTRQKPVE